VAQPQAGIIPEPNPFALFLILRVRDPAASGPGVARAAARVPALVKRVGAIDARAKLVCTVSFGSKFWDAVSPGKRPADLRPFKAIEVSGRSAPSTGGDLLFHTNSKRHDLNLELAMRRGEEAARQALPEIEKLLGRERGARRTVKARSTSRVAAEGS